MKLKIFFLASALLMAAIAPAKTMQAAEQDAVLRDFFWNEFTALPKNKRPKIGVALSAGGLRGFSHVGSIEVLKESGLPVDYMAGTSMGCVVGSLYAAGVPQKRMWELAYNPKISYISKDLTVIGLFRFAFANHLFSSAKFQDFISEEIGGLYYEDLKIPFACVSADIKTGEKVVFDSGPVAFGVRASMNLPGIFAPVEYRQRYLVDGGVVDYMPVDLVREMGADWVLAVFALPDYARTVPDTILGYVVRTGDIRGAVLMENSEREANFTLAARVGDIDFKDFSQAVRAIEIGASAAYKDMDKLRENLILFSVDYVFKQ